MGSTLVTRHRAALRQTQAFILLSTLSIFAATGCGRMDDTSTNYARAINKYYSTHPSCLYPEPLQFPIPESAAQTAGFDALVHQDLLVRRAASGKVTVSSGQPASVYDLSASGHSAFTPDPHHTNLGNFCYGHRTVISVDGSTPTTSKDGATTEVTYRYTIADAPAWAKASEVQADFADLQADLAGSQVGRATLKDTLTGWQVTSAPWAHIPDSDIYK